ncbi:MAG: ATP-binding protein [Bacteroidetes bacterium]|nr:ATP-binding protein [Bacteroidota bacterium]
MTVTNPFKFGSIVSGDYFYNREEDLLRIKQTLAGGNNITLFAPRRFGKSSLVKKVLGELEKEGYNTVYLDLMSVYSQETFITNYSRAIANSQKASLENTVKKIAQFISGIVPSVSFDSSGSPSFSLSWIEDRDKEQTLADVINLPQKLSSDSKKWIIAFDEFQEVTKLNGDNFEKLLRSCIQHHDNVSYLFFGSKTHLLKDMFNNKNRAFYNSASVMSIGKISETKSVEYLKARFSISGITIDDEIAMTILYTAGNIPYYIQFIAYEIWQSAVLENKSEIVQSDVSGAVENILMLKSDYYWELITKQTPYRKKVFNAIAHNERELLSGEAAQKYNLGAVSTTQKALESFIDDGLVERNNTQYEFSDPFFKMFVLKNI